MNRRTYLQALTALFATTALGSCSQGSVDRKEEKLSDKADKAATLLPVGHNDHDGIVFRLHSGQRGEGGIVFGVGMVLHP